MRNKYVESSVTFPWLDMLRGLAALIVVVCHLRALTFLRYEQVGDIGVAGTFFYFFTSQFGSMAVLVFFVLSGFFITRSIDRLYTNGRWGFGLYLTDRLTRLYTVLIPALLVTYFFDSLAYYIFPDAPFYAGDLVHLERNMPSARMDIYHFIGSLFFVQKILIPPFGSNGPLWSLSYEFWYYMLYPLIFFALFRSSSKKLLYGFLALTICAFLAFFNVNILIYFSIWLMGSAVHFLSKSMAGVEKEKHANLKAILATALLIIVMTFARLKFVPLIVTDFLIGIAAAVLTFTLIYVKCPNRLVPISRFLSNISYTVYLIHFPVLAFVSSAIGFYNVDFTLKNVLIYLALLLLMVVLSYLVWWLFERKTPVVRDFFRRLLAKRIPAVAK